jgi:hypothetical protein
MGLSPLDVPEANAMALADFFLPGGFGLRTNVAGTEQLMYAAYPGWILLGLGVLGFRSGARHARLLALGALFFALLVMGPRLYLDHGRSWPGLPNPVYLATYWLVPLANATIHSVDRFMVGVQLCGATRRRRCGRPAQPSPRPAVDRPRTDPGGPARDGAGIPRPLAKPDGVCQGPSRLDRTRP